VEPRGGGGASAGGMAAGRDEVERPRGMATARAGGGVPEEPDRGEEQEGGGVHDHWGWKRRPDADDEICGELREVDWHCRTDRPLGEGSKSSGFGVSQRRTGRELQCETVLYQTIRCYSRCDAISDEQCSR
jgi:hypothetical protein